MKIMPKIYDTNLSFENIYAQQYVSQENIESIRRANCLIIPNEQTICDGEYLFPEGTRDFLNYLREIGGADIIADIAVSDDNYNELELHSNIIRIATCVLTIGVLPVFLNIASNYFYDFLRKQGKDIESAEIVLKIIVDRNEGSKIIHYRGPASEVNNILEELNENEE